jgi:hypothetical protein
MSGGVPLPDVPVATHIGPSGTEDDSTAIQAALDEISKLPLKGGFRGALVLHPGTFNCPKTIAIKASGVVLRGSGLANTTLKLTGSPHVAISLGANPPRRQNAATVAITDAYVPAGSSSFHIADGSSFKVGDAILVHHPATSRWVEFMGMDKLERNGRKETWVNGEITIERRIKQISGDLITVDVPLADSYDAAYLSPPGASISHTPGNTRVCQVAVERLRIVSEPQPIGISDPHNSGIHIGGAEDVWVRDVSLHDMVGSISAGSSSLRVTVDHVNLTHTVPTKGSAKPADISADGTQLLFQNVTGDGANLFYFVTGARVTGPIVLLDSTFTGTGWIQPHQRWATGLLCDNCKVTDGGIEFMNRGQMGSGHGWTIGWSVAWNCSAKSLTFQDPRGAMNWAIGCQGKTELQAMPFDKEPKIAEGTTDSANTPVAPQSLYRAQLKERLGH